MLVCYLCYIGLFDDVEEALEFYGNERTGKPTPTPMHATLLP